MKSGFVALIGRPNVGKSTLMNHLIGQKIAITSEKAQTTRSQIRTVYTDERGQIVFEDTPGLTRAKNKLGRFMVGVAEKTIEEADVILWIVDASEHIGPAEREIGERLRKCRQPLVLAVNKIDKITDKARLTAQVKAYEEFCRPKDMVAVAALKSENIDLLLDTIYRYLPEGPFFYSEDTVTEEPMRELAGELIREQTLRLLRDEVPHGVAVTVEHGDRQGRSDVKAHRHRRQEGNRRDDGEQGEPKALGQGAARLARQRHPASLLRLRREKAMREGEEVSGLVLKSMTIGERDRRITILTREKGKLSCFARGASRQGSPLMGLARPLVYGKFTLRPGRDADIVVAAEGLRFFGKIEADALTLCYASYFLELADYFYRDFQREEEGLKLLYFSLLALEKPELPRELVRRILELKLLVLFGSYVAAPPLKKHENCSYTWDFVIRTPVEKLFTFTVGEEALREFGENVDALRSRVAPHRFRSLSVLEEMRRVQ